MKHHSTEEISSRLRQARELELAGHPQSKVCKMLDISMMTLHRWRKMERMKSTSALIKSTVEENRLLRKVATNLLLEIVELKEVSEARRAA
jgi:hypothetical protein